MTASSVLDPREITAGESMIFASFATILVARRAKETGTIPYEQSIQPIVNQRQFNYGRGLRWERVRNEHLLDPHKDSQRTTGIEHVTDEDWFQSYSYRSIEQALLTKY